MRRLLPLVLISIAAAALAQEIPVSDPVFQDAHGAPSVVASGDTFITVWSRPPGVFTAVTDVSGTRRHDTTTISLNGTGRAIAGSPRGALVAWIDAGQAYTALIDHDGNVINRTQLAPMNTAYMAGAWNGSRFFLFVVMNETVTGYLLDEEGRRISDALPVAQNLGSMLISADPDGFLVVMSRAQDQTIWVRHVESDGTLSGWSAAATGANLNAAVYYDGTHHVIFWQYQGTLRRLVTDIHGAPVGAPVDIAASMPPPTSVVPAGANSLLLLFDSVAAPSMALVSPNGTILQDIALPVRPSGLAVIGSRTMLVEVTPSNSIAGRFVDAGSSITVGEPFGIGHQAAEQRQPDVASNGAVDFVAWSEETGLYGARVDPVTRRPLDGRGILLDGSATNTAPAVVAVGDVFLVAYIESGSELKMRRVGANGELLDTEPILVSATAQSYHPRIATDGTNALLVWTNTGSVIQGIRISPSGTILDPGGFVISAPDDLPTVLNPDVAFNGENYLVVWQRQRTGLHIQQVGVSAARVSPAGIVLDPPIHLPLAGAPRVTVNGRTFGVVGPGPVFNELALATVDAAGVVGPSVTIALSQLFDGVAAPTVAPSREGFLVTYTYRATLLSPIELRAVYVEGTHADGPFDPQPAHATTQWPALIRTPHGLVLTYSRGRGEENFGGSMRAQLLLLDQPRRRTASR